jgi:peptide/nickel transport system substrate-binding protein
VDSHVIGCPDVDCEEGDSVSSMAMRGRTVALIAATVALTASAAGCGGGSNSAGGNGSPAAGTKPKRGGDLVFARTSDNISLDQTVVGDNESIWTNQQMFETLFVVSDDGRTLKPWLATSYDRAPDNRTFTFHLRQGVKFSDGKPMTANDVAWSINRAAKSGKGLTYIDGAIKSVTAKDPATVVVRTKYPWAPLVADISLFVNAVLPADFGGRSEKEFFQAPVGTGPFKLGDWKHGDVLRLVRNPYYWQAGKPYLDSVTFKNVSDENQRMLQLRGGQAQVIRFPPFSALKSLAGTPNVVAKAFPSTRVDYLLMNQKVKPYQDVHVRRAISLVLDRDAIAKAMLFGYGKPADSYLAPTEPYYKGDPAAYAHDVAKAKQEMASSSVPNGFTTTFLTNPGDRLAELVQQQLAQLGIKVTIKTVDLNQLFGIQQKGDYEITDEYWTEDIPDPDERTAWFLNESASNDYFTYNHDPAVKALVARSEKIFDAGQRGQIYAQIQAGHAAAMPQVPLYYSPYQYAWSTKVQGFKVSPLGNYHLEDVWLG